MCVPAIFQNFAAKGLHEAELSPLFFSPQWVFLSESLCSSFLNPGKLL